jgi:hypothetical protein
MSLRQPLSQILRQQQELVGRVTSKPGRLHAGYFTTYRHSQGFPDRLLEGDVRTMANLAFIRYRSPTAAATFEQVKIAFRDSGL